MANENSLQNMRYTICCVDVYLFNNWYNPTIKTNILGQVGLALSQSVHHIVKHFNLAEKTKFMEEKNA